MSNLSHKFKSEHEGKTLHVPGGFPSLTVDASSLTQEHIDSFDEETKAYFFDATGHKPVKKDKAKVELAFKSTEEVEAEIAELQDKYDTYTDQGKNGKHGQAALQRIEELKAYQTEQLNSIPMEKKEWNPEESHNLEEVKNRIAELRHLANAGGGTPEILAEIEALGKQVNILTTEMATPTDGPKIGTDGVLDSDNGEKSSEDQANEEETN